MVGNMILGFKLGDHLEAYYKLPGYIKQGEILD
jgi:hypothetical protein